MEALLSEVDKLSLRPRRRLFRGGRGNHLGNGLGQSLDFYGHNAYTPGDDLRRVDWKAYARTGNFYVKEFSEDRELHVNIILDGSASMDYGNPNKWEAAKALALCISYLALKQGERLSFYVLNHELECLLFNAVDRDTFYELAKELRSVNVEGTTNFSVLYNEDICQGMTFIISDLFGEGVKESIDILSGKGHEMTVIHTLAPEEIVPSFGENVKLVDLETGNQKRVHFNRRYRDRYTQKVKDFIKRAEDFCMAREVKFTLALTDNSPSMILEKTLGVLT